MSQSISLSVKHTLSKASSRPIRAPKSESATQISSKNYHSLTTASMTIKTKRFDDRSFCGFCSKGGYLHERIVILIWIDGIHPDDIDPQLLQVGYITLPNMAI